jgi:hypothetical protein
VRVALELRIPTEGGAGYRTADGREGGARQREKGHAAVESEPGGAPGKNLNFNAALVRCTTDPECEGTDENEH